MLLKRGKNVQSTQVYIMIHGIKLKNGFKDTDQKCFNWHDMESS